MRCCGDLQELSGWCAPPTPFHTLTLNRSTDHTLTSTFQLPQGQQMHFRLFVDVDASTRPLRLYSRHVRGNTNIYFSNRFPQPNVNNYTWATAHLSSGYGFAQTFTDFCPTFLPDYAPGTFAITLEAVIDSEFYLELFHPPAAALLPAPPAPTWQCATPAVQAQLQADFPTAQCVDDGDTLFLDTDGHVGEFLQIALPVPAGCHTLAVAVGGQYFDQVAQGTDLDLYCFSLSATNHTAARDDVMAGRYRTGPDTLTLALCVEAPVVLSCGVQAWIAGQGYFTWSTSAPVLRTPLTAVPRYEYAVSAALGAVPLFFPRRDDQFFPTTLCLDWGFVCRSAWATSPAANPLFFWPIPIDDSSRVNTWFTADFNMFPFVPDWDALSPPSDTTLVVTAVLSTTEPLHEAPFDRDLFLQDGALTLLWITDAQGLPPVLPPSSSSATGALLPSLPIAALRPQPLRCASDAYVAAHQLTTVLSQQMRQPSTAYQGLVQSYQLQATTATFAYTGCIDHFLGRLDDLPQQLTMDTHFCSQPEGSPAWYNDSCCFFDRGAIAFCQSHPHNVTLDAYVLPTAVDSFADCTDPECAESFLADFADALNDRAARCTYENVDIAAFATNLTETMRTCLQATGFGINFQGVACLQDSDCPFPPFQCQLSTAVCAIDLDRAEHDFIVCLLEAAPTAFVEWLATNVLFRPLNTLSTTALVELTLAAATQGDCLAADDPFDLTPRNRYLWQSADWGCVAGTLGLAPGADGDLLRALCPDIPCLSLTCLTPAHQCYSDCYAGWSFQAVTEAMCAQLNAATPPVCNIKNDPSLCPAHAEAIPTCAFCAANASACVVSDHVADTLSPTACAAASACQLPNGTLRFGLTAAQCLLTGGQCNVDCYDPQQQTWHPCASPSACQAAGACSDLALIASVPNASALADPGACFTSGGYFFDRAGTTYCASSEARTVNGCLRPDVTAAAACTPTYHGNDQMEWQTWLTPAHSRAACLNSSNPARFGCLPPGTEDRILWYNPADCAQIYGTPHFPFTWTDGVWRTGTPRPLSWVLPRSSPAFRWEARLAFYLVDEWISQFSDFQTSFAFRSQALCAFEVLDLPLTPLVCACVAHDASCFRHQVVSSLISISHPCHGDDQIITTPSAQLTFSPLSINSGCLDLTVSEINQDFLRIPDPLPTIALVVAPTRQNNATVINAQGAPVGLLNGNGILLQFAASFAHAIVSIELCLLPDTATQPGHLVPDFGYSPDDIHVLPLFESALYNRTLQGRLFWCTLLNVSADPHATPTNPQHLNRFPLYRSPDAATLSAPSRYSTESLALVNTLAALYTALGCLIVAFLLPVIAYALHTRTMFHIYLCALPAFGILCVFRMVYFYAFPAGLWADQSLADFIVFELPTFFYFTGASIVLYAIARPVARLNEVYGRSLNGLLFCFLALIWLLFIATAIAAAVLIDEDPGSPCAGRIAYANQHLTNQFRVLSITYQSLVILFIVIQAALFLFSISFLTKASASLALMNRVFLSSGTIVLGLLARCILFIIYLAIELESTVYVFCTLFFSEFLAITIITCIWIYWKVDDHRHIFATSTPPTPRSNSPRHSNITKSKSPSTVRQSL